MLPSEYYLRLWVCKCGVPVTGGQNVYDRPRSFRDRSVVQWAKEHNWAIHNLVYKPWILHTAQ